MSQQNTAFTAGLTLILSCLTAAYAPCAAAGDREFTWQDPAAEVIATGDLKRAPRPFVYEHGESIRYIDFDNGSDGNDGRSKQFAWKHHPWDPAAEDRAAECTGVHTYVFKRGVAYRGRLVVSDSGMPGNPIRLTCDPSWGEGEAEICGSEHVTGWTMGAKHPDIPDSSRVAFVDLDFAPRNVWLVKRDSQIVRIPLARTPNWTVSDPDDIKSQWWAWDNPDDPWGARETLNGTESHLAFDTQHLTESPEYYEGATIWPEYGWVMSTPYPTKVLKFDPERRALVFGGQWSNQAGSYHVPRHARYYLEDKPQYLDEPGEFWFQKRGAGGRLYLRLPGDEDPNQAHVEVARRITLVDAAEMSHVHITGLTFRFTNVFWSLDAPPTRDKDVDPACIRLLGSGEDLVVANCRFEHVHMPVRMKASDDGRIDGVVIRDNVMHYTDHGAMNLSDGGEWGAQYPTGRLYDVKVLRNDLLRIGMRPSRFGQGHAIEVDCAETAEIAGNCGYRLYGAGIFVYGGKRSAAKVDRPLTRILIHHNRMVDTLLNNNDWGGIETWQGGPAYVFNNVSGNPRGFKTWGYKLQSDKPSTSSFGHAYYMDGGFKQYYFNNIAWGKSKDPFGPLGNCSAFQEIHGFLAMVFNNTVYNFVIGSRRQAPEAGRNKYLGNIWDSIGEMVFRHANPSNTPADPNAADAGVSASSFDHASNAYAKNLFYDIPEKIGVFEPDGRWYADAESMRKALAARHSLGDLGRTTKQDPLVAPGKHDFRPTSAAAGGGVKVFVPWGLYATVAEWPFIHAGDDPAELLDEHFHLAPNYINREDFRKQPMYPLHAVNVDQDDFVAGPLEDWTRGALRLNGRDQYAVLTHQSLGAGRLDVDDEFKLTRETFDWIEFDVPESIQPDQPFVAKMTLKNKGADRSLKLRADLHWSRMNGAFGGMNVYGGPPKEITGPGPYSFRLRPVDKPGLRNFTLTVWLTPTGEWNDRTLVAQIPILARRETAEGYRSPEIDTSNFLVEMYFQTAPNHVGGVLIEKMDRTGYSMTVDQQGVAQLVVRGADRNGDIARADVAGRTRLNDGRWHHVIAEVDRESQVMTLYVDGRKDAASKGVGSNVTLKNSGDLYVGGTPEGRCLEGVLEFARIAQGTLEDAKTTIDELYAWQFDGPFLKDWLGRPRQGDKRAAGAIDLE